MIVYNGGSYDQLHPGHLFGFRQMRRLAGPHGRVVVAVNTDAFIQRFKGHPPVMRLEDRIEMLWALRDVDEVIVNKGDEDSRPTIEEIGPQIIAVGFDWYSEDDSKYCRQMGFDRAWLAERGIRLHYMSFLQGYSSTGLRERAVEIAA